jgi:hypothetical protein
MMRCFGLVFALLAVFLSGCVSAPQQPVSLVAPATGAGAGRIGIAMTKLPNPDTYFPGASCLLCLAAASMANSSLTSHAKTLPYEDLPKVKTELANLLRQGGVSVIEIDGDFDIETLPDFSTKGPNIARKDFSSLQTKHQVDKLLIIDVGMLGFIRSYQAYVPTSDPKAVLQGIGYMVNLKNNTYDWYKPVSVSKSADQNWDESPKFPGLTNAYFQVLELAKDSFLQPFISIKPATVGKSATAISPPVAAKEVGQSARR